MMSHKHNVVVIGGGPAGLMAAETLLAGGASVALYDAMPSVGRKFLLAGKGGMNLTHAESFDTFVTRYGARRPQLAPQVSEFGPQALRDWAHGLGIETFVGSSGRVFPTDMKAAPLLRAWLQRLRGAGLQLHMRQRWIGWQDAAAADDTPAPASAQHLQFSSESGPHAVPADAVVLALGGGSWPHLGSDGAWTALLAARGVALAPLQAANCGFDTDWSEHFRTRFAGQPLKSVALTYRDEHGLAQYKKGQFVLTESGVEGSLIYALSRFLREQINCDGVAQIELDLAPDWSSERVREAVCHARGARSMASHLQSRLGLSALQTGLLRELLGADGYAEPQTLATAIKALPLRLHAARPIQEAISSAGGVPFEALAWPDYPAMLRALPGVFCAGEMLDWEAPTGGYLLTACFAGGRRAGLDALAWLDARPA
jgi:uncharacterized flavoprotein (TIGR03862 family)